MRVAIKSDPAIFFLQLMRRLMETFLEPKFRNSYFLKIDSNINVDEDTAHRLWSDLCPGGRVP